MAVADGDQVVAPPGIEGGVAEEIDDLAEPVIDRKDGPQMRDSPSTFSEDELAYLWVS